MTNHSEPLIFFRPKSFAGEKEKISSFIHF